MLNTEHFLALLRKEQLAFGCHLISPPKQNLHKTQHSVCCASQQYLLCLQLSPKNCSWASAQADHKKKVHCPGRLLRDSNAHQGILT